MNCEIHSYNDFGVPPVIATLSTFCEAWVSARPEKAHGSQRPSPWLPEATDVSWQASQEMWGQCSALTGGGRETIRRTSRITPITDLLRPVE